MASEGGENPGGQPETYSLECTSRDCTLGDNGGRYKTPELEIGLAMQMLVMNREDNHQQPRPALVLETTRQKSKAEKVSRPTIKMGISLRVVRRDLHRYLGSGVDTKSEGELVTEIKRISVITRSNLVNVVSFSVLINSAPK